MTDVRESAGSYRGVIDLGSNSVRLVIYREDAHGFPWEVEDVKRSLRLIDRLRDDGTFAPEAVETVRAALRDFLGRAELFGLGPEALVGVATQVFREARDGPDVLASLSRETGISFRLLSGEEEAFLGACGATTFLPFARGVVVDVGGGSTEITAFCGGSFRGISIPWGAVDATRALSSDPPTREAVAALRLRISREIAAELARHPEIREALSENGGSARESDDACKEKVGTFLEDWRSPVLIGIGGTVRSVARVLQAHAEYPLPLLHGFSFRRQELERLAKHVLTRPLEARRRIRGLSSDRAEIIPGGALVLLTVWEVLGAERLVVGERGLREGVLLASRCSAAEAGSASRMRLFEASARRLRSFYPEGEGPGEARARAAAAILDALEEAGYECLSTEERRLILWAARLRDVGRGIDPRAFAPHTFYLLLYGLLYGLTHRERVFLAATASFSTRKAARKALKPYAPLLPRNVRRRVVALGTLLRLAEIFGEGGGNVQAEVLPRGRKGAALVVSGMFRTPWLLRAQALEWTKKLGEALGVDLELELGEGGGGSP
ncbi:MAG: Exopolyphosphatase [Brockia lithotrophica]|uniref:Exopolyphosphatase n=1 Tax=Brockia lithotrophica TaxID=933949 RepID=A0A2T5G970_9BACL|nr:MAG: Exopolyphosphatase [Brockia lithotrophica]